MKNKHRYWLIPLVCLMLLTSAILPASAQPADGGGFTEEFDELPTEGWEFSPDIAVDEGQLRLWGGNMMMRPGAWGDAEIKIRFQVPAMEGEFIIHYFMNDQGSYNLILTPDHIILEKGAGEGNILVLAEADYERPVSTWTDLDIKVENGQHGITLDEEELLSASDPDPFRSGGFGIRYFGPDYALIDSLSLNVLNLPEIPADQPVEEPVNAETQPVEETDAQEMTTQQTSATNWVDSIEGLFDMGSTQIDLLTFVINLLISVVLAYILGRVYIYWGSSLSNRRKFAANFMLMTVTTTFIILVVRSSVALSLGLVGALSIVRFRTAVKEPEELAYIFFAIGIGIGLGVNQRLITIIAFGVAILIMGLLKLFRKGSADVNLHLTVASENPDMLTLEQIMEALTPHTAKLKLLRLDETDHTIETAFLVEFKHIENLNAAKAAIQSLAPKASITFLDNKGIW